MKGGLSICEIETLFSSLAGLFNLVVDIVEDKKISTTHNNTKGNSCQNIGTAEKRKRETLDDEPNNYSKIDLPTLSERFMRTMNS